MTAVWLALFRSVYGPTTQVVYIICVSGSQSSDLATSLTYNLQYLCIHMHSLNHLKKNNLVFITVNVIATCIYLSECLLHPSQLDIVDISQAGTG